jgi:hypothetical protein
MDQPYRWEKSKVRYFRFCRERENIVGDHRVRTSRKCRLILFGGYHPTCSLAPANNPKRFEMPFVYHSQCCVVNRMFLRALEGWMRLGPHAPPAKPLIRCCLATLSAPPLHSERVTPCAAPLHVPSLSDPSSIRLHPSYLQLRDCTRFINRRCLPNSKILPPFPTIYPSKIGRAFQSLPEIPSSSISDPRTPPSIPRVVSAISNSCNHRLASIFVIV